MSSIVIAGDTSGSVTLQAPAVSGSSVLTLPAVTDTVAGIAATQTLTNKSIVATQLTGTIAGARLPAGTIVQVVSATYSTAVTSSTSTYVDTGLTATITPSSASNKILALVSQNGVSKNTNDTTCKIQLLRGASSINVFAFYAGRNSAATINSVGSASTCYLDSPATTSATTYKTQFASSQNNASATVQEASETSTITLLEVVA